MGRTLLKTKLYKPHVRSDLVQRSRLVKLLDEGMDRKLVVISAPAGYGKTTLLSAWAADCGCPVAWLSLDESDNDPARFLSYLVAAAQTIEPNLDIEFMALLQSPQPAKIEELLPALINQLDNVAGPYTLVLDDYHLITLEEIHKGLAFLIDHLPQSMHLILATRTDPPLPIAQLRARGQLVELRQADLRFTGEEAASFLHGSLGIELRDTDTGILLDRTEGWIAGLQLAALSMRNHENISQFIADFGDSHEYIVDFFADEIFSRQPERVKSFLLKTSILEQLCGPLCDHITGLTGGGQTLEELREANLFVFPMDDQRHWYRYHHLFGGLLRKQLQHAMPEIIPELHRRASRWFEEHRLFDLAFDHAASASDQAAISRLVDAHLDSLWSMGETRTIQRWIGLLSPENLRLRPELDIGMAMVLADDGKISEAEERLRKVDGFLDETTQPSTVEGKSTSRQLQAWAKIAHAWTTSFGRNPQAVLEYAQQALRLLTKRDDRSDRPWMSSLYIAMSTAHLQLGDQEAAERALSDAIKTGKLHHNHFLVITAMTKKVGVLWSQGRINRAALVCQEGLSYIEMHNLGQVPVIDSLLIMWGFILRERGELGHAEDFIQHGLKLSRMANHIYVQAFAHQEMILLLISKGDLEGAEEYIKKSDSLAEQYDIPEKFVYALACLRILISIYRGKLAEAERELWLRGAESNGEIDAANLFLYLCFARLLLVRGNLPEAQELLERIAPVCQSTGQVAMMINAQKLFSLLFAADNEMRLAVTHLGMALELAEPEGYVQTFLDEGEPMARLVNVYVRRKGETAFASRLLTAFHHGVSPTPTSQSRGGLIEPLSERECEVLGLLADGLSNQAIAARLFLSLPTIKFHAGNIYSKLGVKNRVEAVAAARKLGLLA